MQLPEEALQTYKYLLFLNPKDRIMQQEVKELEDRGNHDTEDLNATLASSSVSPVSSSSKISSTFHSNEEEDEFVPFHQQSLNEWQKSSPIFAKENDIYDEENSWKQVNFTIDSSLSSSIPGPKVPSELAAPLRSTPNLDSAPIEEWKTMSDKFIFEATVKTFETVEQFADERKFTELSPSKEKLSNLFLLDEKKIKENYIF